MASTRQSKVAAERRARVEEMRRQQLSRERRTRLLITGGGGVVAVIVIVVIVLAAMNRHTAKANEVLPAPVDLTAATTTEPAATVVKNPTTIDGVVAYDTSGHVAGAPKDDGHGLPFTHVDGPVRYSVTPPVGGNHNATWMNCGVYDSPVVNERAVHNLEHGAIWITYEPSLPKADLAALKAFVAKQSMVTDVSGGQSRYMDLTPWSDSSIGSPIVMSAWGYQLKLTSPADPRMQQFVDTFRASKTYTPEISADGSPSPCGGQPVNISGNPLS